jgi:hypothetical protein
VQLADAAARLSRVPSGTTEEIRMPGKRPNEPIGPTTVPGQRTDPKIPPDEAPTPDEDRDTREETESDEALRDSEQALDRAVTHIPPD